MKSDVQDFCCYRTWTSASIIFKPNTYRGPGAMASKLHLPAMGETLLSLPPSLCRLEAPD